MPDRSETNLSLRAVRDWCTLEEFHPNRVLGQNFLVDGNIRSLILSAVNCRPGLNVVEIGPGLGALTAALLECEVNLTAIEKDERLHAFLKDHLGDNPLLTLLNADALDVDLTKLLSGGVDCLVSNLPYSTGTRILMDWVRHPLAPPRIVVALQREVAERLAAGPGSRARGLASIWAQLEYEVRVLRRISPGCFWPRPAVDSSLVVLNRHGQDPLESHERLVFAAMTRYAFMHRRKQLLSAWRHAPEPLGADEATLVRRFEKAGVAADSRPEALDLSQWRRLARVWSSALEGRPIGTVADIGEAET